MKITLPRWSTIRAISLPTRIELVILIAIALFSYQLILEQGLLLGIYLCLGFAWRFIRVGRWQAIYRKGGNRSLERFIVPQALFFLLLGSVIWVYSYPGSPSLNWVTGFLLLLTVSKLLEYQSDKVLLMIEQKQPNKDIYTLSFVSFFLLFIQTIFDQSITNGLFIISGALFILVCLWWVHAPDTSPTLVLRSLLKSVLIGVPFIVILFVMFPRISTPLWRLPQPDKQSTKTGVTDRVSINDGSPLSLSDDVAMQVRFDGPPPPTSLLYWRGPTLSIIRDGEWFASAQERALQQNSWYARAEALSLIPDPTQDQTPQTSRYELTIDTSTHEWLFPLESLTTSLQSTTPIEYSRDGQVSTQQRGLTKITGEALLSPNVTWKNSSQLTLSEERLYTSYPTITSLEEWLNQVDPTQPFMNELARLRPSLPQAALEQVGINPLTQLFGRWLEKKLSDPFPRIGLALQELSRLGYLYSLETPKLGPQASDDFLFTVKEGYCQHFAVSFGFLMRAAKIPTRLVGGYLGGDLNQVDNSWQIKERDAHVWTEIWISQRGWIRVDPTAMLAFGSFQQGQSFIRQGGESSTVGIVNTTREWSLLAKNIIAAINNRWNEWVLQYGTDSQENWARRFGFEGGTVTWLLYSLIACVGFVLLIIFWVLYRESLPTESKIDRWMKKASEHFLMSQLPHVWHASQKKETIKTKETEISFIRQPNETWLSWIQRLEQSYSQLTSQQTQQLEQLKQLINHYQLVKYVSSDPKQTKQWIKEARQYTRQRYSQKP